jgi:hypothetical protein
MVTIVDAREVLWLSGILIGVWSCLSSLQWLAEAPRFRNGAALGWDLLGLRRSRLVRSRLLALLFGTDLFVLVPALRLGAGVMLLFAPPPTWALALLVIVLVCSALLAFRGMGSDGADKMGMVATGAAILIAAGLLRADSLLVLAGLIWAAGQLTIAYATSGFSKLALKSWRNGSAVTAALGSYTFGHRLAYAVVRYRTLALVLSWVVMVGEALFPLALFAPQSVLVAALVGFALFHFAIAVFMGLNTYPWAFIACYPSAIILTQTLRRTLGWD